MATRSQLNKGLCALRGGGTGLRPCSRPSRNIAMLPVPLPRGTRIFLRSQWPHHSWNHSRRYISSTSSNHNESLESETASARDEEDIICSIVPAAGGEGLVATVTLSNPRRLNSLSRHIIHRLTSTLESLGADPDVRCVVVKGAPTVTKSPSFTSGANIYQMASLRTSQEAKDFISGLHAACNAVRNLPVVTIAQIDGLCLGGGLELAAACDFRYATRRSTFGMPETKYGIPSVIEARLLANIIGWQKTKEMVYFARMYDAHQMERWGLVDQCCETEELEDLVSENVATISGYGNKTMREQKRLVKFWEETDLVTGVEAGVAAFARMFEDGGREPARYMKSFIERKR